MRYIKYTQEAIQAEAQKAYDEVVAKLSKDAVACQAGAQLDTDARPQIFFDEDAWWKAMALIEQCDKEIAWYGFVDRDGMNFTITDITVPPQTVTGTSVESDSNEWALWAMEIDNEKYNKMRCHMHSHVNMGVFSSGTDDDYQKDMVTKNGDLNYYIFLIFNKKGDIFARVYDCADNKMYDDCDVDVHGYENMYTVWAQDEIDQQVTIKSAQVIYGSTAAKAANPGNWYQQKVLEQIEQRKAEQAEEEQAMRWANFDRTVRSSCYSDWEY